MSINIVPLTFLSLSADADFSRTNSLAVTLALEHNAQHGTVPIALAENVNIMRECHLAAHYVWTLSSRTSPLSTIYQDDVTVLSRLY